MNCSRARSHLGDHLEGDLDLSTRARIDAHLADCAPCANELGELRATIRLLRSLPPTPPPAQLASRVMQRIESAGVRPRRAPAVVQWLFQPRLAAAMAAGLVGFAIFTSVETSWVVAPDGVALAPTAPADQSRAIEMWEAAPPTLADLRAIEPRLAAIERTAANRFYRPDTRLMDVGFYGRVDPDSQQLDLDGQLDRAKVDPGGFLRQIDQISEPERRSRIAPLVVRAGRRGDARVVAHQLRATAHPLAAPVAAEFDPAPAAPMGPVRAVPASAKRSSKAVPASY